MIGVAFLVQLFTGIGTWDECLGGNDTGELWTVLGLLGASGALLVAEGFLLWRGGIAGRRLFAVAVGVVTAGALLGTWALVAHHPYNYCTGG